MKVLCLGGGPAGLYFAISMKLRDPSHQVTVLERNKANDTFGDYIVEPITRASAMASCNPVSEVALPSTGTRIFSYMDKSSEKTHRSPAHHHHRD